MQLNAKNTALVLIDLQKGVLAMPVVPHTAAAVYERSILLAQRFRDIVVDALQIAGLRILEEPGRSLCVAHPQGAALADFRQRGVRVDAALCLLRTRCADKSDGWNRCEA